MSNSDNNPLLTGSGLPRFDEILPQYIRPAIDHVLDEAGETISRLEALTEPPCWDNYAGVLESMEEAIDRVWSPISHLNSVMDSEPLRAEYEQSLAKITNFYSALGQNEGLYRHYKTLADGSEAGTLSIARQKIIENALRDFKLAGVALPDKEKARFRDLQTQLSELQNQFSKNVLDATQAWFLDISDENELTGLPQSSIDMARSTASDAGLDGWRFGLQTPSYLPFVTHADSAVLRETMYRAYTTRASSDGVDATSGGKFDNGPLITRILELRHELAQLLGYRYYADVSLATKMAESPGQVDKFLDELVTYARPIAKREVKELERFANDEFAVQQIHAWDLPYYSEKNYARPAMALTTKR